MSFIDYSWEKLHDFVDATFPNVTNHSTILGHRLYTIKQIIYLIQHHSIGTVSQSEADMIIMYKLVWARVNPTNSCVTTMFAYTWLGIIIMSQYKCILQPNCNNRNFIVSQSGQFLVQNCSFTETTQDMKLWSIYTSLHDGYNKDARMDMGTRPRVFCSQQKCFHLLQFISHYSNDEKHAKRRQQQNRNNNNWATYINFVTHMKSTIARMLWTVHIHVLQPSVMQRTWYMQD